MLTSIYDTRALRDGHPGFAIAPDCLGVVNTQGVVGTMAGIAIDAHDRRAVLLTTHHLLFAAAGREGDPVWAASAFGAGRRRRLGTAFWGRAGIVRHEGRDCYVDCALAWCEPATGGLPAAMVATGIEQAGITQAGSAQVGGRVTKVGHASGKTRGVILAVDFTVEQSSAGRRFQAPGQILVRPDAGGAPFLVPGDSGAMLRDEQGQALGLLWGVNSRGEGLASPIGAVIAALGMAPHALAGVGARAA